MVLQVRWNDEAVMVGGRQRQVYPVGFAFAFAFGPETAAMRGIR
jgi:hypothetical protein